MKIRFVHPQLCTRKLVRGDVKRLFAAGPLLGYFIACPGCGFYGSYLHSEAGFTEVGPVVTSRGPGAHVAEEPYRHPTSLRAAHPMVCFGCRHKIVVNDGELELVENGAATPTE